MRTRFENSIRSINAIIVIIIAAALTLGMRGKQRGGIVSRYREFGQGL